MTNEEKKLIDNIINEKITRIESSISSCVLYGSLSNASYVDKVHYDNIIKTNKILIKSLRDIKTKLQN